MNYNYEFLNVMDEISKIVKERDYKNTREWMESEKQKGRISGSIYNDIKDCIDLRNKLAHGYAKDISISQGTYNTVLNILNIAKGGNSRAVKRRPLIDPDGYCYGYTKEFNMTGANGENYYFRFKIVYEENFIDTGYGGIYDTGYFIHVEDAPKLYHALSNRHRFHIISGDNDEHICWKKVVKSFEEANAIMFVWVKRYVEILNKEKQYETINEAELERKTNKKGLIPADTYCTPKKTIKIRQTFKKEVASKTNENTKQPTTNEVQPEPSLNTEPLVKQSLPVVPEKKKVVYIKESVYNEIMRILGTQKPELGGMLGYSEDQLVIDHFVFDKNARVNSVEYNPNTEFLNGILYGEWETENINFAGIVHSHPGNMSYPSYPDVKTACKTMESFDLEFLFTPIVTSSYEYKSKFNPYIINRDGTVESCTVELFKGKEEAETLSESDFKLDEDKLKELEMGFEELDKMHEETKATKAVEPSETALSENDIFARIRPVINIPYMQECSIIGIGCGSAKTFYENMARVGVGNFYLMDGDISSLSNVASQNGYLSEVGKPKVDALKNRLLDINQNINVTAFNHMLTDEFDDKYLEENILNKADRNKTILCSFTDSFEAQKRTAELAIKYSLPYLATQHHNGGTTSELVYWFPGVSKYTPQFILKDRYTAYANGHKNQATSVGSPIFNSMRVNSLSSKIATGMLVYNDNKTSDFCSFLNDKPECNLLFIKQKCLMNTDSPLKDFFYDFDLNFFDETAWVNPETL